MIKVEHLTKEYKRVKRGDGVLGGLRTLFSPSYESILAVNDISFQIDEGELVGYIGPNGAGKSTSIKMLRGILVSTNGAIEVNGLVPHKNRMENARQIGAVFGQKTQLWWDVPVIESLRLFRVIVTGLIPVAFMNYYPALILLGKIDQNNASWLGYLSPMVALILVGITSIAWHLALRRYSSSGG